MKVTSIDEDGNALAVGEKFSVSLTWVQDYAVPMHTVDAAANGESTPVDLPVGAVEAGVQLLG